MLLLYHRLNQKGLFAVHYENEEDSNEEVTIGHYVLYCAVCFLSPTLKIPQSSQPVYSSAITKPPVDK